MEHTAIQLRFLAKAKDAESEAAKAKKDGENRASWLKIAESYRELARNA